MLPTDASLATRARRSAGVRPCRRIGMRAETRTIRSSRSTATCSRSTSRSTAPSSSRSPRPIAPHCRSRSATSIRSFVDNLKEPLVFANDLLQGRGEAAGITGRRFIINSTWGIGGLFDKAAGLGMSRQSGDFGQTLFAWGVGRRPVPDAAAVRAVERPRRDRDGRRLLRGADRARRFRRDAPQGQASVGVSAASTTLAEHRDRSKASRRARSTSTRTCAASWRQNRQATLREARDVGPGRRSGRSRRATPRRPIRRSPARRAAGPPR